MSATLNSAALGNNPNEDLNFDTAQFNLSVDIEFEYRLCGNRDYVHESIICILPGKTFLMEELKKMDIEQDVLALGIDDETFAPYSEKNDCAKQYAASQSERVGTVSACDDDRVRRFWGKVMLVTDPSVLDIEFFGKEKSLSQASKYISYFTLLCAKNPLDIFENRNIGKRWLHPKETFNKIDLKFKALFAIWKALTRCDDFSLLFHKGQTFRYFACETPTAADLMTMKLALKGIPLQSQRCANPDKKFAMFSRLRTLFHELVGFPLLNKQHSSLNPKRKKHPEGISCTCGDKLKPEGLVHTWTVNHDVILSLMEIVSKSQCCLAQDSDKKIRWNDGILSMIADASPKVKTIKDYFK